MNRGFLRLSAAALVLGAAAACAPVTTYSGFRPERNDVEIADPQVGVDTRSTVQQRFGSPSTTAVFDQTAWYYVSATQQRIAFYTPRTTDRRVMVVRFDGDMVSAVEKFGMERGRLVSYSEDYTPTRGRELGLLEQLLGNVGQTPQLPNANENEQGPRRDRN
jgi:outer membrane protein assembly factor BamE (lipoprotein component of BamABCDE complex)